MSSNISFVYPSKLETSFPGSVSNFKISKAGQVFEFPQKKRPRVNENGVSTEQTIAKSSDLNERDTHQMTIKSRQNLREAILDKKGNRPRANSTDLELNLPKHGLCQEDLVLTSHVWRSKKEEEGSKFGMPGLSNLGNTCFLNATVQCLAYLPPFAQTLSSLGFDSSSNNNNHNNIMSRETSKHDKLAKILALLFRKMHNNTKNSCVPKNLVGYMPKTKMKFRLGRQEDAHEFLVHLLDALKHGELMSAGINPDKPNKLVSGTRLDETTFVHRVFGGYLRSQIVCPKCNYKSNTYDPFFDLALEISNQKVDSIMSSLAEFTRKEKLDSDNKWRCGGCKQNVCATKRMTVYRPPLSLCIQLKRFSFNSFGGGFAGNFGGFGKKKKRWGGGWGGSGGGKISKAIAFPLELSLPLSDKRTCKYSLTGVVIHIGGSSNSGHYTAYVRGPPVGSKKGQWYYMDDSCATPVSENRVTQQKDAYLLFYCRQEVKLEIPNPPPSKEAEQVRQETKVKIRERLNSFSEADASLHNNQAPSPKKKVKSNDTTSGKKGKEVQVSEKKDNDNQNVAMPDRSGSKALKKSYTDDITTPQTNRGKEDNKTSVEQLDAPKTPDSSKESATDFSISQSEKKKKEKGSNNKKPKGMKMVLKKGDNHAGMEVISYREKSLWKPQTQDEDGILGSLGGNVSAWDDDDEMGDQKSSKKKQHIDEKTKMYERPVDRLTESTRDLLLKKMKNEERQRKKRMRLDRWDAKLDEGKRKKVKSTDSSTNIMLPSTPKNNQFQRLQNSMQRLGKVWNKNRTKTSSSKKKKMKTMYQQGKKQKK